ncbi:hypothetical protein COT52_00665 [candidate division WWE3 bacterium CG08_land_8_20_14_0_20_43_13]|uniref:Fimbrial assembly protein n=1 Tax=candidate division WWE3 bacterium CG08_land_8_20_14_0_20_43_13 TaxID=1975087 RepID=A0A2H0X7Z2_UNCKA|nr:MAG: hypothetical protein COT52_00665 [candidate division WWE3 bacterium CG08_land_8_20_14_0_20_43_13]
MKTGIELLTKKKLEEYTFGKKLLIWASTIGRIIIFTVQAIVLAVFACRFVLDKEISDQISLMEHRSTLVSAGQQFEKNYREAQAKIKAIDEIKKTNFDLSQHLANIIASQPPKLILHDIAYEEGIIQITGEVKNPNLIAQIATNLKKTYNYKRIVLTANSYNKGSEDYKFSIQIYL